MFGVELAGLLEDPTTSVGMISWFIGVVMDLTLSPLSDGRFRETLELRTLGCARSLSLLLIYALAR